jgi:uncharacterized protein YwgA
MTKSNAEKVAQIIRDAGGRVVGRTRLQKIAYLLWASGLESGFSFSYRHYGPFSEDLAAAARDADLLGLIKEYEQQASWGGSYSIYETDASQHLTDVATRRALAMKAAESDSVELELAATAVFLEKEEGHRDPWAETARRKPEKAGDGRIDKAKELYRTLQAIKTPVRLPTMG